MMINTKRNKTEHQKNFQWHNKIQMNQNLTHIIRYEWTMKCVYVYARVSIFNELVRAGRKTLDKISVEMFDVYGKTKSNTLTIMHVCRNYCNKSLMPRKRILEFWKRELA